MGGIGRFSVILSCALAGESIRCTCATYADSPAAPSQEIAAPAPPLKTRNLSQDETPVEVEPPLDPAGPSAPTAGVLELSTVLDSIVESYPLLEIAVLERTVQSGNSLAARGAFDTRVRAESLSQPLGFYRTYRNAVGVEQPLWRGGEFDFGYRKGDGNFEPWYGGRETDEGGELGASLVLPWLQNRQIDARRASLFRANIDRDLVEPDIQAAFLDFARQGALSYWTWLATGQAVIVNRRLVELAASRQAALQLELERGRTSVLAIQDNDRLLLTRKAKLLEMQQKMQSAAIKLSLFLRDEDGQPIVASPEQLPRSYPTFVDRRDEPLARHIETAIARRPEMRRLEFERRRLNVDLGEARNAYLPRVDSYLAVRDDVGTPASAKGDKSELEFEAGVMMAMPVQRRAGIGKMQAARGKLAQWNQKQRFTRDKITVDVEAAVNELRLTHERVQLAREASRLAEILAEAERERVARGKSDLFELNFREAAAADTILAEIQALYDYFAAEAELRFATASDLERIVSRSLWAQ